MTNLATFDDLLRSQVQDLYSAEKQFAEALPKMAEAATTPALRDAFEQHAKMTRGHIERIEKVAQRLGVKPNGKACPAAKGLVEEGREVVQAKGDPMVIDAGLIAAAQRIEHYEIAGYGTLAALANRVGNDEAASLAAQTLEEERAADEKLTKIAERSVNEQAAR